MKIEITELVKIISDKAANLNACSSELNRMKSAKTYEEVLAIIKDNASWVNGNNLFTDIESIEYFGVSVSNLLNSGDWNSGNRNSGNRNSGDSNSGYRNSGNRNSGNRNSGDSNSGDWNSGNRNSGNRNSGNWNSGNRNSGDSNSGYRNSGAFCTDINPKVWLFDSPTNILVRDWEQSRPYSIMYRLDFNLWIPSDMMSDTEKANFKSHKTTGGYLKVISLKDAWLNLWGNLSDSDKAEFTSLPNFDAKKFEEITGINVNL